VGSAPLQRLFPPPPPTDGRGGRTASANPDKLDDAAEAVPAEVTDVLARAAGPQGLAASISEFNRASQSPQRITVPADLSGPLSAAVATGAEIDAQLGRVAAAFRAAGNRPFGPGRPPGLLVLPDAALASRLETSRPRFRSGPAGGYQVLGPNGQWYRVSAVPPLGAAPLARREGTYDFGNDHLWLGTVVDFQLGSAGGIDVPFRAAPPEAYDHVNVGPNGIPHVGPGAPGHDQPLGPLPPDGLHEAAGAIVAAGEQHAHARHMGVVRTQATYYVDPQTGENVAVVDAAGVAYSNTDDAAHVRWGRLASDEHGNPTVVPTPDEDCGVGNPPGQPIARTANPIRVPLDEDD
jgi:hypothetical protein